MALLEVKGIKKSFGNLEVLKGVDFTLDKGQVLTIIGSSGSGKTTLLRCLNFLEKADEGSIAVNDELLFDATNKELSGDKDIRKKRLHFGLVFQSFNLFPQYNVVDNITLAPTLQLQEKAKAYVKENRKFNKAEYILEGKKEIEKNAYELLEKVGLTEKAKSYPCELSGGQNQRVAIARALALKPDILCFDEPTSALDPELTSEVLKVIKGLKSKDRTMIIVTHEMEFAKKVSDKVIFMADGVVEEIGTAKEVFDNPQSERTKAFLMKNNDNE